MELSEVKGVRPKKASKLLNNFGIETYCDLGNPPMKKKPLILNAWKLREIMWNNHVTIMSRAGIMITVLVYPYAPWCWNMNPNICLRNHPNVGKYT